MKAYTKHVRPACFVFRHEEMDKILKYLKENGTLHIDDDTVKDMYLKFSRDVYYCNWQPVDERSLKHFATWLSVRDV